MKKPRFTVAPSSDPERFYLGKVVDGRDEPTFNKADITYAAQSAQGCQACNVTHPEFELPAVYEFAEMAKRYHDAARTYLKAKGTWEQFTTGHGSDDPAHEWHSQQVTYARNALNVAGDEYTRALDALLDTQGHPAALAKAA